MKTTKTILTMIAAAAAMNLAAFAGDLVAVSIPNGHGQTTTLYRDNTPTVALFVSGQPIAKAAPVAVQPVSQQNGHGQTTVLYRAVK
jgi:hypothetical protein